MPYDGNGNFVRVHNWQEDADNAIDIVPDRHDEEDNGFADGLSNVITKDGQTTPTANIPMGGFRHTGVGDASARTHYASAGQIQDGALTYATSGGSANAYTLTPSPAITAYAAGQCFKFKANFLSTGAATLAVSGLAAKDIKVEGLFDLPPYAIKNGQIVEVEYDGTAFQILNLNAVTGDLQDTISSTPKPGWLILNGTTTIGSASSGASIASAYAEGLYRYIWDRVTDTYAAVSTGRGANAAADFAANKTLTLPDTKDRIAMGVNSTIDEAMKTAGADSVTSTGTVGTSGATTITTSTMPAHTHTQGLWTNSAGSTARIQAANLTVDSGNTQTSSSAGSGNSHTHTGGALTMDAHSIIQKSYGVYHTIKI
jgi:hypothetical protein